MFTNKNAVLTECIAYLSYFISILDCDSFQILFISCNFAYIYA